MFHEDILEISYHKSFKTLFLISNMHCLELHLDNFKGDFLNIYLFLLPQISWILENSCISGKYCHILTNHTSMKIWFVQFSDDEYISINKKKSLLTGFVVQGHIT